MPRLPQTPSPTLSPTFSTMMMPPSTTNTGTTTTIDKTTTPTPTPTPSRVTYIPPLRDGACGTTPRAQQPPWSVLRRELAQTARALPALCRALLGPQARRLPTSGSTTKGTATATAAAAAAADVALAAARVALACFEAAVLLAAGPLWLVLPGAVFAAWVGVCVGVVAVGCWVVNHGREQMVRCDESAGGLEDEKWLFVGGMGMSPRHCHKQTLPALSRLFNRPVLCVCRPTYGMPFDVLAMMLQRCGLALPSQARRNLYSQMRCALLDDAVSRCVVLCHNDSAVLVSQAVAQLCADLPREKLGKLEVYTFGAAACEFMMPLGDMAAMDADPAHPAEDRADAPRGVHVEHFAMTSDPFAQLGVLHSVRQDMEGRFCGSVFIMNGNISSPSASGCPTRTLAPACSGVAMEDYLMALFPEQMTSMTTTETNSADRASVLDSVMTIDRDCAEKREIAAMSSYHAASQAKKGRGGKRLSWTGLAAMAGQRNGVNAGMVALEMARRGCRNCDGHTARDVSWLARYVDVQGEPVAEGRRSP